MLPTLRATIASASLVLNATIAGAQAVEPPRPLTSSEYDALVRGEQEPTYASIPFMVFGLPRQPSNNGNLPILYEATIAPPLVVSGGRRPLLIAITPKVVVRQYYGGSYPVPPPSFMPRISAYWWGWPYAPRTQIDSAVAAFTRVGRAHGVVA